MLNCKEFVNADEIAKGLSPFQPEKVAFEAGRIMLQRIDQLLNNNETLRLKQRFRQEAIKIKLTMPRKRDTL
ncbi:hypothetical protein [Terrimonas sp.]|uniref:hypothetical protein n=1 Tax=Terrimonas sp. TaxID=1914338 RepID=UPI0019811166|nr:hypothetical protein [Terrimonas sp.]